MASIIERYADTPVTLLKPAGIEDGKPRFSRIDCLAIVLHSTQFDVISRFSEVGTAGTRVYVAPLSNGAPVTIDMRVELEGRAHIPKAVKLLKDLRGNLLGYRLEV